MRKRLALFTTSLAGGGAERVMLTLAEGLSDNGNMVDLVVTNGDGPLANEVPKSVRLVDLRAPRIIASLPVLVRYLRRERPQVILSALAPANCIAVLARAISGVRSRLILSEHSTLSLSTDGALNWQGRILPALMRRAYPRADAVVAVSSGVADDLTKTIGLARSRMGVIHNPVVTPRMRERSREPVTHPWFAGGGPPVILGVGRLTPAKDFATLIRAFAAVRRTTNARLMILGEGPDREQLENLIRELGLENDVSMPGFVENPYAYMRASKLFVLSSRWEGFGNVLVEAMACGTPVVSTDCPSGPREILEGGKWGRLVPRETPSMLTEAIVDSLRHAPKKGEGRAGFFSADRATKQYESVLLTERLAEKW